MFALIRIISTSTNHPTVLVGCFLHECFFSDVAHRPLSFWIFYLKGERKVKITIRYGEQLFIVDVSENIYLALDEKPPQG